MTYLAGAELAVVGLALCVQLVLIQVMRAQVREHARREDLLVNQICNLAGKPWQPPPPIPPPDWALREEDLDERFEDVDQVLP